MWICRYGENFDCDGNCLTEVDCDGNCGGDAVEDCNGDCDGTAWKMSVEYVEVMAVENFDVMVIA